MIDSILNKLRRSPATLVVTLIGCIVIAFTFGALIFDSESVTTTPETVAVAQTEATTMWTCAMHPQIRLPHSGQCPICFMDLIPVKQDASSDLGPREIHMSENARELAKIQTSTVTRGTAMRSIHLYGSVVTDKRKEQAVVARVSGRLDTLYANYEGMSLKSGDPICSIYSPELVSAQKELHIAYEAFTNAQSSGSNVQMAKANYQSAREKLRLLGITDAQIAEMEHNSEPKSHVTILAQLNGYVVQKQVQEGNEVKSGQTIVTIADLSDVWVEFEAYENDLGLVHEGQQVSFTVPTYPGQRFRGTVSYVDPILDPQKRTGTVRVVVNNSDHRLKPNMLAEANLESPVTVSNKEALLIPASAALLTGKRAIVYVQRDSEMGVVFEGREVTLGPRAGDFYVVTDGLSEGEVVVTNGAFQIDSELQLQGKRSMMNPESSMRMVSDEKSDEMDHSAHGMKMDQSSQTAKPMQQSSHTQAPVGFGDIYAAYFSVQEQLADDSLEASVMAFHKLHAAVMAFDTTQLDSASRRDWVAARDTIVTHIMSSLKGDSATIETLRDVFFYVSNAMIQVDSTIGHPGTDNHYLIFCPMAREGDGAFWLQTHTAVDNSYWGAKMLKCGSVKDTIKGSGK